MREVHQHVHDRAANLISSSPAHRVPEERVAREARGLADEKGDTLVRVTRGPQNRDRKPSRLDRVGRHGEPEAGLELVVPGHMIRVAVGYEQVRRRQLVSLDHFEQRLERSTAVDEDGGATWLVGDEVRVREPRGMHAPLDDHARDRTVGIESASAKCARPSRHTSREEPWAR